MIQKQEPNRDMWRLMTSNLHFPTSPTVKKPAISQGNRGDHPDSATGRKGGGFSIQLAFSCSPLIRIYQNNINLLLMEEILHELIGSLSHYFQGFIHPRWCRISSINSIIWKKGTTLSSTSSWCILMCHSKEQECECFEMFLKQWCFWRKHFRNVWMLKNHLQPTKAWGALLSSSHRSWGDLKISWLSRLSTPERLLQLQIIWQITTDNNR